MFQLKTETTCRLRHINIRQEKHGKTKVSAADFDFVLEGSNEILNLLSGVLLPALYHDPDAENGQATVEGVQPVCKKRLLPQLGTSFKWSGGDGTGMDMCVVYGLGDERSNIDFEGGRSVVKSIEAKDNGLAEVHWRFSTSSIPAGALDKLHPLQDSAVTVTLIQNERMRDEAVQREQAIDGSAEAFERDHPDAGDIFAQQHSDDTGPGDEDSEGGETDVSGSNVPWPFPKDGAGASGTGTAPTEEAPEDPGIYSRSRARTARGRERTKKALAAGAKGLQ